MGPLDKAPEPPAQTPQSSELPSSAEPAMP